MYTLHQTILLHLISTLVDVDDGSEDAEGHCKRAGADGGTSAAGGLNVGSADRSRGRGGGGSFRLGSRSRSRSRGVPVAGLRVESRGGGGASDGFSTRRSNVERCRGRGALSGVGSGGGSTRRTRGDGSRAGSVGDLEHGGVIALGGTRALADLKGVRFPTLPVLGDSESAFAGVGDVTSNDNTFAEVVRVTLAELNGDDASLRIAPARGVRLTSHERLGGDSDVGERVPVVARALGDGDGGEGSSSEDDVREMHFRLLTLFALITY